MICLVKHFLSRVGLKLILIFSLVVVVNFLGTWQFVASKLEQAWYICFMVASAFGMIMLTLVMQGDEFDMVLPVPRRTLYLAQSLAALMLVVILAAPVTVAALAVAAFQGGHRDAWQPCATFALIWIAILLTARPVVQLVKGMCSPMAMGMGIGLLFTFCLGLLMALKGKISGFMPIAMAVLAAALAWVLFLRQFERYELIPNGDAEPAQGAAARSGLTDRFPPMIRVLAHAVWLRWWYAVVLAFVAYYCFMFTANASPELMIFWFVYAGCGTSIIQLLSGIGQPLLPYVPRRMILRSVLGPVVATPLLIGGVKTVIAHSAPMILLGLAISLLTVAMTWFALPSAKDYGRPFRGRLRGVLSLLPCLGFFVCAFVPPVKLFIAALIAIMWSGVSPWVKGNPALVCSAIVFASALLWWRCERKFKFFEPSALPAGFRKAA